MTRRVYRMRIFDIGEQVRTPLGLTAEVIAIKSDGRYVLRYTGLIGRGSLVVLQPKLLRAIDGGLDAAYTRARARGFSPEG